MKLNDLPLTLDISKIPTAVLNDVAKRGNSFAEMERMPPETFFDEYCRWHGLIGWGHTLLDVVTKIREATIKK